MMKHIAKIFRGHPEGTKVMRCGRLHVLHVAGLSDQAGESAAEAIYADSRYFGSSADGILGTYLGTSNVAGKQAGQGRGGPRVKDMIEMTGLRTGGIDAHGNQRNAQKYCMLQVVSCIPADRFRSSHREGGQDNYAMSQRMVELLEADYGGRRLLPQQTRSCVVPEDLGPGEALALIGRAVYLPAAGETPSADVQLDWRDPDGRWHRVPLANWRFYQGDPAQLQIDERPPGIYPDQRYLMIGGDYRDAPIKAKLGFAPGERISIDVAEGWDHLGIGEGGGMPEEVPVERPEPGVRVWRFEKTHLPDDPEGQPECIVVTVRDRQPVAVDAPPSPPWPPHRAEPSAVFSVDDGDDAVVDQPTVVFGFGPREGACLLAIDVEAIALPKLPAESPIQSWMLELDGNGEPSGDEATLGQLLRLRTKAGSNSVFLALPGANRWQTLSEATKVVLANGRPLGVLNAPSGVQNVYHGLLKLETAVTLPLAAGRQVLGRVGGRTARMLTVGLLEKRGSLTLAANPDATLEQCGLSREHLELWVEGRELCVSMKSENSPVWRLSAELEVVEEMLPESSSTMRLGIGERLLVGPYLFQLRTI